MLLIFQVLSLALVGLPAISAPTAQTGIKILNTTGVDYFTPYTYFASTAYCLPSDTISWTCGTMCKANPDFIPVASGGDGNYILYWYVGFSPSLKSVIVGHQGMDPAKLDTLLLGMDVAQKPLDQNLFPGFNSSIIVHSGFADAQALTAKDVLTAVRTAISSHNATQVAIVGWSMGASIALLNNVYLSLQSLGVPVVSFSYGGPRLGNKAFADYVDNNKLNVHRINHKRDLFPTVPWLGYQHPYGEVHIDAKDQWVSCPGQDNPDPLCTTAQAPSVLLGNIFDHYGPYNGIMMGCTFS